MHVTFFMKKKLDDTNKIYLFFEVSISYISQIAEQYLKGITSMLGYSADDTDESIMLQQRLHEIIMLVSNLLRSYTKEVNYLL